MKYLILAVALTASQSTFAINSYLIESVRVKANTFYLQTKSGEVETLMHCPVLEEVTEHSQIEVKPLERKIRKNSQLAVNVDGKREVCRVTTLKG